MKSLLISFTLICLVTAPVINAQQTRTETDLYNTSSLLRTKCVDGITVNERVLSRYMETTVG